MSRDGSGNYSLPAGNPVVTNTVISSTWANNTLADIAAALTQSLSKDGQTTPTADLSMGNFKLRNLAAALARTDAPNAGQIQDGGLQWLTAVAGTDTITASSSSPSGMSAYVAGQSFRFVAAGTNTTGIPTLNINGIGAKNITRFGAQGITPGDITSGSVVNVTYDGTQFQIDGNVGSSGVIGYARNLNASLLAQGPTVTVTADEITLQNALGGVPYKFANVSKTINISTTGLNGIDTGILSANSFCAVYWIYNPTTGVLGLLGQQASNAAKMPEVYAGGNAPSGFTISSLAGIWPAGTVNATFAPFGQVDRKVDWGGVLVLGGSSAIGSVIARTSTGIPYNARMVGGFNQVGSTAATTITQTLTSIALANAGGQYNTQSLTASGSEANSFNLSITTPQTIYQTTTNTAGTPSFTIGVNSYTF